MIDQPKRIQLSRVRGWRKPEGAIVVSRPSRWGNPFVVGADAWVTTVGYDGLTWECRLTITAAVAVELYRDLWPVRITHEGVEHPDDRAWTDEWITALGGLRGHDLACWCGLSDPCHADVLLDLANQPETA